MKRIASGTKCSTAFRELIKNRNVSRATKIQAYKVIIRTVVTYASEMEIGIGAGEENNGF